MIGRRMRKIIVFEKVEGNGVYDMVKEGCTLGG